VIDAWLLTSLPGLFFGGLCVFFRFFTMAFVGLPFGFHGAIPIRVRVFLIMHISMVAFIALGMQPVELSTTKPAAIMLVIVSEVLLGLAMGLIVRMVIWVAEGFGTLVSMATGLGFAVSIDPGTGVQSSAIGRLATMMTMLVMIALNVHLDLLAVVFASFKRFAPGAAPNIAGTGLHIAQLGSEFIEFSFRLAAPVLMVSLIIYLVLAVITRVAPQLNLFAIGFPLLIVGGLMAMGMSLHDVVRALSSALEGLPDRLVTMLLGATKP